MPCIYTDGIMRLIFTAMEQNKLTQYQLDALTTIMSRSSEGPITGKEIASIINLKPRDNGLDGADLRSIVHALRTKGYPICADTRGYWWPANVEELDAYIVSLQGRIDMQQEACDALRSGRSMVGAKKVEEVVPQKLVPILWSGKVHMVAEDKVVLFLEQHNGSERV